MGSDIGIFGVITSMINIISLVIIWFNVKLNKNIDGLKLWVIGNVCNVVGVLFLILREVSSNRFITIIVGNELIVLGEILIYIGLMKFIGKKLNYKIIASSYVVFTMLYVYLTYINDNIGLRVIVFSFFVSIYLILAGVIILKSKNCSIKLLTNFLGGALLTQGFFFGIRGIITMRSTYLNSTFYPSIMEIGTYIISITMTPLISFGLILMVNEKLNKETQVAKEKYRILEEKNRILIENTFESIIVVQDEKLKFSNPTAAILTGYLQDELASIPFIELIYQGDRELVINNHLKRLSGEIDETRYRCRVLRKDREIRWVEMNSVLIQWDGKPAILNFQTDITQRKKSEEEIMYLSYHDQLTGVYNRRFYEKELKNLDIERNLPLTLIMGDVNGLKLINDAFGHLEGDKLIKEIAESLKRECRNEDILARVGGDEFIILLPKTDSKEAQKIVNRIKASISNKKLDNMILSASFGWGTKYEVDKEINKIYVEAEDHMYRNKLFESKSMKSKTIELITKTLYEKNEVEQRHCERVSEICENIGNALELSSDEMSELKIATIFHDIGKVGIDERILNKPGMLNDDELSEIKRHPEIGYQILRSANEFSHIAEFILAHHERWDGKGYPKALKRDEIPLVSRIIAIADAYDAMTSERNYRGAFSYEAAVEELEKNAGSQFDPELVSVFIEKVLGKSVGYNITKR
ncbi:MAG: diguanylate cyclase [Clostridium sp.]|uniref:bifunctional diguanylate cyclase/phosphohydrolase n=1 Tax=Clostridium sp. TaxID=1506 RepID=UPI0030639B58